ncbi:MAG: AI-2E family transporter [Dermatophilaceae bacterium]|nr:AI-2E family transporter [Dermatophilaceae bacterium]
MVAFGLTLRFIVDGGGSVIFTVLMSWLAAIAMAPLVDRSARRLKRGAATIIVMAAFVVCVVIFVVALGRLMVDPLSQLIARIPDLLDSVPAWSWARSTLSRAASSSS